jgi:acid phosphatase type 7
LPAASRAQASGIMQTRSSMKRSWAGFLLVLVLLGAGGVLGLPGAEPASATTTVFDDDFESGDLSRWTKVVGLVVQGTQVFSGAWAARATGDDNKAFAWKLLGDVHQELVYSVRFKVLDGTDGVKLLAFKTQSGSSIVQLGLNKAGKLYVQNQVTGVKTTSSVVVQPGDWHLTELRTRVGSNGRVEVSLDGLPVTSLNSDQNLGTTSIGRVDLGDNRATATFDAAFDDVAVTSPSSPPPVDEVTIAAAGDIACDPADGAFNGGNGTAARCAQMRTSDLLVGQDLDAVLVLGDAQYECGGYQAFLESFDPSWGRVKSLIRPAVGNHEYKASGGTDCDPTKTADGYFDYFGAAAGTRGEGYYSFDMEDWHLVALNSNCSFVGGCSASSPQGQWFTADLAANPSDCSLAYDHHPRWSSGEHGSSSSMGNFYRTLYQADGEIFLSGHDHAYERFAPQAPDGSLDPDGVRQFVAGAGGGSHYETTPISNSEVAIDDEYGVLFLTLQDDAYQWAFVSEDGDTLDSGSTPCH